MVTNFDDRTPERPQRIERGESGETSGPSAGLSAVGCVIALGGVLLPTLMMSAPSFAPCSGECVSGWSGAIFMTTITPILVIIGGFMFFVGMRDSGVKDEPTNSNGGGATEQE